MSSATPQGRRRAAEALAAAIGRGEHEPRDLLPSLASTESRVRWGVAWALWRSGNSGPEVLRVFLDALAAEDTDQRWAAASLLSKASVRDRGLLVHVSLLAATGTSRARAMALVCLASVDPPWEEAPFLVGLGDGDRMVRLRAVTAFSRRGVASAAAAAALRVLAAEDRDAGVRRAAAAVVARLLPAPGGEGAQPRGSLRRRTFTRPPTD